MATGTPNPAAGQANVVSLTGNVNASGDGITLSVAASGTQGHPLTIAGEAPSVEAGGTIDIDTAKAGTSHWKQVAAAVIGADGAFSAVWIPSTSAQVAMRAVLATGLAAPTAAPAAAPTAAPTTSRLSGAVRATAAAAELSTSTLTIPIFKSAIATLYGPGFWGRRTACGERLRKNTLGVASRTLRCGTRVAVDYKGREITVPVIDRGPFSNHADWDLTMATAAALGIRDTETIGALAPAPASLTSPPA